MYRRGMRAITFAVVVGAAAAGACEDPRVAIEVRFPDESLSDGEEALDEDVDRLEVSVFQFNDYDCNDLAFGRVSVDVQNESRRGRVVVPRGDSGFRSADLSGIPRLADSVIAVRGLDASGLMLAGGCTDIVDDIEDDLATTIALERSLIVRVLPSELVAPSLRLPAAPGAMLAVVASERRHASAVVPLASLQMSVRTTPTDHEEPYGTITAPTTPEATSSGIFTVSGLVAPEGAVGPIELVVRGRWADQVNTVSAMVPAELVGGISLTEALGDGLNQVAPTWAVFELESNDDAVVAVARYRGDTGPLQVVVVREINDTLVMRGAVAAPGVRTLTVLRDGTGPRVVSRTATGWVEVMWNVDPPTLMTRSTETTTAADQLLGLPPCAGPSVGVLGVVGPSVLGWRAVDGTAPSGLGDDVGRLAAAIGALTSDGGTIELLGAACLAVRRIDGVDTERPVVAVRHTALGREVTYLVTPELAPVATPFVGGVSVTPLMRPTILAATVGASGPRVGTFRLRYDDPTLPGALPPALVPDGFVDHPLPTAAMAVAAVRSDEGLDSVALHALPGQLGMSMTRGSASPGHELSAMMVVDVEGDEQHLFRIGFDESSNKDEVMIAGDHGLAIFDLTKRMETP